MPEPGKLRARACGDDLVSVAVADAAAAQALAATLRRNDAWLEVVPGADSVTVQFDPAVASVDAVCAELERAFFAPVAEAPAAGPAMTIAVRYGGTDGPDLDAVCRQLGLTPAGFVDLHTAGTHRVEMLGFTPGFAYVAGLDARLAVCRLPVPRQRVPAGSVGIAGAYTGLYALNGPGGWPLVGRASLPLFDAGRDPPFLLLPSRLVRFTAETDE